MLTIPNLVDSPEGACPQLPLQREASRAQEGDRPLRLDRALIIVIEWIAFQQSVVRRSGESRRAKLFYLRDRVGKAVRLTEKRKVKKEEGHATENTTQAQPELAATAS